MSSHPRCSWSDCALLGKKTCSRCKSVYYCSPEHQKVDWTRSHRKDCKILRDYPEGNLSLAEKHMRYGNTYADAVAMHQHTIDNAKRDGCATEVLTMERQQCFSEYAIGLAIAVINERNLELDHNLKNPSSYKPLGDVSHYQVIEFLNVLVLVGVRLDGWTDYEHMCRSSLLWRGAITYAMMHLSSKAHLLLLLAWREMCGDFNFVCPFTGFTPLSLLLVRVGFLEIDQEVLRWMHVNDLCDVHMRAGLHAGTVNRATTRSPPIMSLFTAFSQSTADDVAKVKTKFRYLVDEMKADVSATNLAEKNVAMVMDGKVSPEILEFLVDLGIDLGFQSNALGGLNFADVFFITGTDQNVENVKAILDILEQNKVHKHKELTFLTRIHVYNHVDDIIRSTITGRTTCSTSLLQGLLQRPPIERAPLTLEDMAIS